MYVMYDIAYKYPELLHIINDLFIYRNALKHSEKRYYFAKDKRKKI